MGTGFQKFKKKIRQRALVTALLLGLAAGGMTSAVWMLLAKLSAHTPNQALCFGMGGAVAIAMALVLLLALLPRNRRLAKRLDTQLNLREKVQTMVAFANDKSAVAELQRQDTDRVLCEARIPKAPLAATLVKCILPVISCAALAVALMIPVKTVEPPAPDEPPTVIDPAFALSEWQEVALKNLIEDVRKSALEDPPKADVVARLEALLEALKAAEKESEMKAAVIGAIVDTSALIDAHNAYDTVSAYLRESTGETVKQLGTEIASLHLLETLEVLDTLREPLSGENAKDAIAALIAALDRVLVQSEASTEPMYSAFVDFTLALTATHAAYDTATPEETDTVLNQAFAALSDVLTVRLFAEDTNEGVRDTIRSRLMQIFNISKEDLPPELSGNLTDGEEDGYTPGDDDTLHTGGFGSGEVIYGSDDIIYDPETGEHVSYGTVIQREYAKVSGYIIYGTTTEDAEQILTDYFASLLSKSQEEN